MMNQPNCQTNKWTCHNSTGKLILEFDGRACAVLHIVHKSDTWTTRGMEVFNGNQEKDSPKDGDLGVSV
jgi:hypothetical protein